MSGYLARNTGDWADPTEFYVLKLYVPSLAPNHALEMQPSPKAQKKIVKEYHAGGNYRIHDIFGGA